MSNAWVSFCISTYKRTDFLKDQIALLLTQTFPNFEIVISDNDPLESGRKVAESFNDIRIKYFANGTNIGMIASFNKSIERANTEYIVMVTDDDPVDKEFLNVFYNHYLKYPNLSIYCGFERKRMAFAALELIDKNDFLHEVLHPRKTNWLLWSSSIMKRADVLSIGKMPDYGSPHLADHALIVLTGSMNGGLIVNKKFSDVTLHKTNFSKTNLKSYVLACKGFHDLVTSFCKGKPNLRANRQALLVHIYNWFIGSYFSLKKYYSAHYDPVALKEVESFGNEVIQFSFMRPVRLRFKAKLVIFYLKWKMKLLN